MKIEKRPEPIVIVEIWPRGPYQFVDKDGEKYAEVSAQSKKEVCSHCGGAILYYGSCYEITSGELVCVFCVETIQMGDLWAAYNEREVKQK